jgi:hypothetical protein
MSDCLRDPGTSGSWEMQVIDSTPSRSVHVFLMAGRELTGQLDQQSVEYLVDDMWTIWWTVGSLVCRNAEWWDFLPSTTLDNPLLVWPLLSGHKQIDALLRDGEDGESKHVENMTSILPP